MKKQIRHIVEIILCLVIVSCGKISPYNEETIVTGEAMQITKNSVILWGSVNNAEVKTEEELGFILSTSETPSLENGLKFVSIELDNNNKFFVEVMDLKSGTKYYYKAFRNVGGKYRVGDIKSFTTDSFQMIEVDLGLPSGLKWANCNIGATTPEDYGDYYAWGENEPHYSSQNPLIWREGKAGYMVELYQWCNGSYTTLMKYNNDNSRGTVDNKVVLDLEDDVANVKLGGSWRMPTDEDWEELRTKCSWIWTMQNGAFGRKVIGPNHNSIFLPAAGYFNFLDHYNPSARGVYWSSSLNTDTPYRAWVVEFNAEEVYRSHNDRGFGRTVRPVSK